VAREPSPLGRPAADALVDEPDSASLVRYAATTELMTSGATASRALTARRLAIITDDSGRRSTETQKAPTRTAIAGVSE
jgi:hypothetical protein